MEICWYKNKTDARPIRTLGLGLLVVDVVEIESLES